MKTLKKWISQQSLKYLCYRILWINFLLFLFLQIHGQNEPKNDLLQQVSVSTLLNKADSLQKKREYLLSNKYYQEAFFFLKNSGETRKEILTGFKIIENLKKLRKYNQALLLLADYQGFAEKEFGKTDSITAIIYHQKGTINNRLKKFDLAIENYKKAISIRKKIFSKTHHEIIKCYHNLGIVFHTQMVLDSAIYYFNLSINSHPPKFYSFIGSTYTQLARAYSYKEDFQMAKIYYDYALEQQKIQFKNAPWKVAKFYYSELSSFYLKINEPNTAIQQILQALNLLTTSSKLDKDPIAISTCYSNLGYAYWKKNENQIALKHYFKALKILKDYNVDYQNDKIALNYSQIGIVYKYEKDYKKSEEFLNKAFKIYSELKLSSKLAKTYDNLGDVFFKQSKYQKALECYHKSIQKLVPSFRTSQLDMNPKINRSYIQEKQYFLVVLSSKAHIFKKLYDQNQDLNNLKAAYDSYLLLDELIDQIRLSYLEDASKSYLVKETKHIYEKAIGVCLLYHQLSKDQQYLEQAFLFAEKSKAIILLEQIKESSARSFAGIPHSIQQQEKLLKNEIGQIEKQLALNRIDSIKASLSEQLIYKKRKYEDLIKSLEKNNASYHQLKYDLNTANLVDIQKNILKDNQVLLEYFIGEDSIYCFKISPYKQQVFTLAKDFPLSAWVDSLRQGIYYCRGANNKEGNCELYDTHYVKYATQLYQKLISPLGLSTDNQQLIIIPDAVLGYIPFDALLTKEIPTNQQKQYQLYPYFGLDKTISYAYSATFLKELQKETAKIKNNQLLAFAPSFQLQSDQTTHDILAQRSSLAPLFFNQKEIEKIGQYFPGKLIQQEAANKANFIKTASEYRYLHLASHGKMNDEEADLSYIAFTQIGDSTNHEELLYLRELYDMEIDADMVVLSACETGIGELQNGEGIISLARGFSYAGAKSIITSLWSVNDQKTSDLMVDFYHNLAEGLPKDKALATAKSNFIQNNTAHFAHPYYWAGFIPIGNMEKIAPQNNWMNTNLLLFGLVGLIGLFGLWKLILQRKMSPKTI